MENWYLIDDLSIELILSLIVILQLTLEVLAQFVIEGTGLMNSGSDRSIFTCLGSEIISFPAISDARI